jgi:hypothetical protein
MDKDEKKEWFTLNNVFYAIQILLLAHLSSNNDLLGVVLMILVIAVSQLLIITLIRRG